MLSGKDKELAFEIFGLRDNYTNEDVSKAYRRLLFKVHTDYFHRLKNDPKSKEILKALGIFSTDEEAFKRATQEINRLREELLKLPASERRLDAHEGNRAGSSRTNRAGGGGNTQGGRSRAGSTGAKADQQTGDRGKSGKQQDGKQGDNRTGNEYSEKAKTEKHHGERNYGRQGTGGASAKNTYNKGGGTHDIEDEDLINKKAFLVGIFLLLGFFFILMNGSDENAHSVSSPSQTERNDALANRPDKRVLNDKCNSMANRLAVERYEAASCGTAAIQPAELRKQCLELGVSTAQGILEWNLRAISECINIREKAQKRSEERRLCEQLANESLEILQRAREKGCRQIASLRLGSPARLRDLCLRDGSSTFREKVRSFRGIVERCSPPQPTALPPLRYLYSWKKLGGPGPKQTPWTPARSPKCILTHYCECGGHDYCGVHEPGHRAYYWPEGCDDRAALIVCRVRRRR